MYSCEKNSTLVDNKNSSVEEAVNFVNEKSGEGLIQMVDTEKLQSIFFAG